MKEEIEKKLVVRNLSPPEALELSIQIGLLDPVNDNRFAGEAAEDEPITEIVVPALRRVTDFEAGESVWIYHPTGYSSGGVATVTHLESEADLLVLETVEFRKEHADGMHSIYVRPFYYGLWKMSDLEKLATFNLRTRGKGYFNATFLIHTLNSYTEEMLGLPESEEMVIANTHRKINALSPVELNRF